MTLPPYSPSAKCAKCGSERVDTAWHQRGECFRIDTTALGNVPLKFYDIAKGPCADTAEDHLLRHCSNCGFEWLEAPMDAPPARTFSRKIIVDGKVLQGPLRMIVVGGVVRCTTDNDDTFHLQLHPDSPLLRDLKAASETEPEPAEYPSSGGIFDSNNGPLTREQFDYILVARWEQFADADIPSSEMLNLATSFYRLAETWRMAVDKQPKEIKDQIFAECDRVREVNGWMTPEA